MSEYKYSCDICHTLFKQKCHLEQHKSRKKPCKNLDNSEDNELKCKYCLNIYSRKDVLERHIQNSCKMFDEVNRKIDKLQNAIDELKKNNASMSESSNGGINGDHNTQTIINKPIINNTTNINIKLNAYGEEDLSKIPDKKFKEIFNKGTKSVQEFVLNLHFNENLPENHNICVSNLKDKYVSKYDGKKWVVEKKDTFLDELYDDKSMTLENKFKDMIKDLNPNIRKMFSKFLSKVDDDEMTTNVKEQLKILMYNNREIVQNTKKMINKSKK